jgi:ribosome recycling factor
METIRKQHEQKAISDDDKLRLEKEVQRIIDGVMESIDSLGKQKEAELLQI